MIRTYVFHKDELKEVPYRLELFSKERLEKIEKLKREEAKELSVCAELLLIYALRHEIPDLKLPLPVEKDERGKLFLKDSPLQFNLSHGKDYVACAVSDQPVGIDIESFKVRELMYPEKILHPEEARLMAYISNSNEKKKYFFECWVAKESYLKNLGIGLMVRPSDFLVNEDELMIRDVKITKPRGSHKQIQLPADDAGKKGDTTLRDNLALLERRYVHVFTPGEIRGTDWKFDANYRCAVCSMQKDPDHIARQVHADDLNAALKE